MLDAAARPRSAGWARRRLSATAPPTPRAKLEAADAAIGALQEQVLAAGGVALRVQKAKVEGLHEALDNEANAATAAKAKSEGVRKKVTKTEEGLAKIAAENKELEASRAAIGERLTALEKEAEEVVAKMEACRRTSRRSGR